MSGEPAAKKSKMNLPEHLHDADEKVKQALLDIDDVQTTIDGINELASEEILKIEQKYNSLRAPHFTKRADMIKNVPRFWSTAIINHPQLGSIVEEREQELLHTLTNIDVDEDDDIKKGFKIRFTFGPNDHFENQKIEKEFLLGDSPSCTTSPIKWKSGKSLARKADSLEPLSFFEWLSSDVDPTDDDIAEILKDDLYPNPVQYYLCPDMGDLGEDDFADLVEGDEDAEDGDN